MLSSVEQAFVGRDEIRAPLKTPAWEAKRHVVFDNKSCRSFDSCRVLTRDRIGSIVKEYSQYG